MMAPLGIRNWFARAFGLDKELHDGMEKTLDDLCSFLAVDKEQLLSPGFYDPTLVRSRLLELGTGARRKSPHILTVPKR